MTETSSPFHLVLSTDSGEPTIEPSSPSYRLLRERAGNGITSGSWILKGGESFIGPTPSCLFVIREILVLEYLIVESQSSIFQAFPIRQI
jgi:hypothetical protein